MNVLSLFDGMSCGQIALRCAGIKVANYYASEIEKGAIKLTKTNFPNTVHIGDITNVKYADGVLYTENGNFSVGKIDLIIGGSPCQGFSVNGKKLNFDDSRSKLFFEYKRLIDETGCSKWLYENVATMSSDIKSVIDEYLGSKGVFINSSILSAQNRKRYYWSNFDFDLPGEVSEVKIADVLESDYSNKLVWSDEKIRKQNFNTPYSTVDDVTCINPRHMTGKQNYQQDRIYKSDGKFVALTATLGNRFNIIHDGVIRKLSIREQARLQVIPEWYEFDAVSDIQSSKCIGNGWTISVISHILKFMTLL
jgi:DNA-cytosine methyltransferase